MNQRAERRKKNDRRILPTVGDRRGSSESVEVLDWSEPTALDWSDDEQANDDRAAGSGDE